MGIFVYIVATLERGAEPLFMAPFWLSHPDFLLDNTYGHGEEISKKYKEVESTSLVRGSIKHISK